MERQDDDIAQLLTVIADLRAGYPWRDLAAGWDDAAWRLVLALRADGIDDDGTWDTFDPQGE